MEETWDLNEILERGINAKLAAPAWVKEPPLQYAVVSYALDGGGYLAVIYENGAILRTARVESPWSAPGSNGPTW